VAARRNSVITFWIGSSELGVQSPSLALSPYIPCRLSLFFPIPSASFSVSRFCCSSLAHYDPSLAFPREHNYRLRVPSQWIVNGKPYFETPTYHHKPLVNSDLEKRFRGSTISACFLKGSNRAICLTLDRSKVSFHINERRFNYLLILICSFISVFNYTVDFIHAMQIDDICYYYLYKIRCHLI